MKEIEKAKGKYFKTNNNKGNICIKKKHCFPLLGVSKAVDLCAAPGSWSQVLARKLK